MFKKSKQQVDCSIIRFLFETVLVIRICFGFRVSCFEFIENRISKQFSLSQSVISLNDVALYDILWVSSLVCY